MTFSFTIKYQQAFPGIENQLKAHIYPNPANTSIQITLPAANYSGNIGLYDLSGKKVATTLCMKR